MARSDAAAIITGGGSGFGAAIAKRLAADGHPVVIADLDRDAADGVVAQIGETQAMACQTDVSDGSSYRALVEATIARWGRIGIVVNNAGYTHSRSTMEAVSETEFNRVIGVNLKALYHCGVHVVPHLRAQRSGTIVNIASTAAFRPGMALTWYAASKGAVVTATAAMAMELGPFGVRVAALAPVIGETGLLEKFMGQPDTADARARFSASIPLGRFCTPEDVAAATAFLVGPDGAFVNGHCLPVDGGFLAGGFSRPSTVPEAQK